MKTKRRGEGNCTGIRDIVLRSAGKNAKSIGPKEEVIFKEIIGQRVEY